MPHRTIASPADMPFAVLAPIQRRPCCASELRRNAIGSLAALSIGFAGPGFAEQAPRWSDSYQGHLEALAVMEQLNSALLASHSATQTLETWCAAHHMATPARIAAQRVLGFDKPIDAEQRARLQIGPDESVRYRRVRLTCGAHVLSEADNWYVPSRLTPEMNRLLEATDIPFGRVVLPLRPQRQTLSVEYLWSPLPDGWEVRPPGEDGARTARLVIPASIFRHKAMVVDSQGRPIAEVAETYTGELLNFDRQPAS